MKLSAGSLDKLGPLLGTLAFAAIVSTASPTLAVAATQTTTTHAAINHSTIHLGSTVTIVGYVSPNLRGHVVRLQRYYSNAWHTQANHALSSTSRFSLTMKPTSATKYTYRVYNPPTVSGYRSSVSRTLTTTVESVGTVTLVTYTNTGDWQGPIIRIPVIDYTIRYRYSCADPYSNYLSVAWNGRPDGLEYVWDEVDSQLSGSGTWYGHEGARSGYFDIGTQTTCSWTFTVTYRGWR